MKAKYKVTGCFKFFLVLIILAPVAYIGASYFNGQDGIQNFKELIGLSGNETPAREASIVVDDLESELENARMDLESVREENERLKQELEACKGANN